MKTPKNSQEIINLYRKLMIEVRERLSILTNILQGHFSCADVEFCALNLRKIAELMVFSVAVANKNLMLKLGSDMKTKKASEMFKILDRINPRWYPVPRIFVEENNMEYRLDSIDAPFLEKREWKGVYDLSSTIIHAQNPYSKQINPAKYKDKMFEYTRKLIKLLEVHTVLVKGEGYAVMLLVFCHLDEDLRDPNALPEVTLLTAEEVDEDKIEFLD